MSDIVTMKKAAAEAAVGYVEPGMVVGLGAGSTAVFAIRKIGALLKEGRLTKILGIACSRQVEADATDAGVPLTTLEEHPAVDLTIDGADEVAPNLDIIKGGGGALLREKIVAQASLREIIVVDQSKVSDALGRLFKVPVEVVPFGWRCQEAFLQSLGAKVYLRHNPDGGPYQTDQSNYILDCDFGPITDTAALAAKLDSRAGIVEHGMFLGVADEIIIAGPDGVTRRTR
jgi:ribose 5-phosphate isomerase A